jgi:hypothetical protein
MKLSIVALAVVVAATPASAQWLYQGNESAFGDSGLHLAVTGSGNYGFGLRCSGEKTEAIYMTPDTSFDSDAYKVANMSKPILMIRIDDNPIVEIEAELIDTDGKAAALGDVNPAIFAAVRDAKKRVAVALKLLGENYHEKSFNVRGSGNALKKVIAACNLPK